MTKPPDGPQFLLSKHKGRPIVLDANLLALLFVGQVNRSLIATFKRTRNYLPEDFDLLCSIIDQSRLVICTPNVFTEVSNLFSDAHDSLRARLHYALKVFEARGKESYYRTRFVVDDPACADLGVSDAALLQLCARGLLLVTSDLKLHLAALSRSADCVNFNQLRPLVW